MEEASSGRVANLVLFTQAPSGLVPFLPLLLPFSPPPTLHFRPLFSTFSSDNILPELDKADADAQKVLVAKFLHLALPNSAELLSFI